MSAIQNRQIRLRQRPGSMPQASDFELVAAPLGSLPDGRVRVRNEYLSIDPAMRVWLGPPGGYMPPVQVGEVMRSFAVGRVVESALATYRPGDALVGVFGWQDYADAGPRDILWRVTETDFPLSCSLGVLGISGMTAYIGVTGICQPRPGETFVVSTAAGAVGSAAGQIAGLLGARSVGISGGADKRQRCLGEFGFAAAVDYKAAKSVEDLAAALRQACPTGIDSFFDNTAGVVADVVRHQLNPGARIALCGTAAVPGWDPWPLGERVERHLLNKRAMMRGFVITDHADQFAAAQAQLASWLRAGALRFREQVLFDLSQAPGAIALLFEGRNDGKLLVRVGSSER